MIKQGLFVLCEFFAILSEKMELSKKKNRKRSFVASEEEVKQDVEERTRQRKRNKAEFDVLVALCKEMKDKNPTPEWRQNMLKRSSEVNKGRALLYVLIIPTLIREMPPYKEDGFASYRNPVWSQFQAAHRRYKEQQLKEQRVWQTHGYVHFDLLLDVDVNNNQDLTYKKPVPSENDKMLADLLAKFHISGGEDDCEDPSIESITKNISSIAIVDVKDGEDGKKNGRM